MIMIRKIIDLKKIQINNKLERLSQVKLKTKRIKKLKK